MRVLRLCSVYGAASASTAGGGIDAVGGMQVHTDRTRAASMGASGLATARGHGTDALAEATLDTYGTVLGRAPLRVP